MRDCLPRAPFRMWLMVLDLRLQDLTGRMTCDLPIPERTLRLWWASGRWTAHEAANALALVVPPVVTIQRSFADPVVRHRLVELRERFRRRGVVGVRSGS